MILAGDISGTKTDLATFTNEGGKLEVVAEQRFVSHDYAGLEEIIKESWRVTRRMPAGSKRSSTSRTTGAGEATSLPAASHRAASLESDTARPFR
jgi:glucokinase